MNCWACAPGLEKNDAAATATAINFAFIRIILPLFSAGSWTGQSLRSTYPNDARAGKIRIARPCARHGRALLASCSVDAAATGQVPIVARCRISFASGEAAVAASAAHVEAIFLSGDEHETVERSTNDHRH